MPDSDSSQFVATMLGSGFGVVAGVAVQYGVQTLLSRRQRSAQMADIRAEAVYNEGVVGDLIQEAGRLRACCNPGGLTAYLGVFRFNDIPWIALNRMVQSGLLYRSFSHLQIQKIQQCTLFISPPMGQLVANRIAQVKANNDHVDGINFANYLETEFRKHLETIQFLKAKH